jgi:serine protease DegQ
MEASDAQKNSSLTTLSQSLAMAVEKASPLIVAVDARPRVATSGVIWRPGVVVSTNHTVRRDEEISVTLGDGRRLSATLAGRDPGTDLAVLRVEDGDGGEVATPAQVADASMLKVGNLVLAVGRTYAERGVTASFGIVSVAGERWRTWRGGEIDRLIRPEVSIFIGFSGGALVDAEGRMIGINTTGLSRGAGVTIPASTVDRVVDQLLARGRVARPYLGVGMHPVALPDKLREKHGLSQATGLMMFSVEADAPADRAGITIGDILLALDDAAVSDTEDAQTLLGGKDVGAVVRARILRGGEVKEVEITLGERSSRETGKRNR